MRLFHVFALMLLTACCITTIVGCDEGMNIMGDVITEPTEMPEKPEKSPTETEQSEQSEQPEMETTVGGVKQDPAEDRPEKPKPEGEKPKPEKPEGEKPKDEKPAEEPTEPIEIEPEGPEYITLDLPSGYSIPLEFTPTKETVLSNDERALMLADESIGWDPTTPLERTTDSPADAISLLPYKDREEVYELFVASVNLPFFAEAAKKMKEVNIKLGVLNAEARNTNSWEPYDNYREEAEIEQGFLGLLALDYLRDIYFEENPEKIHLKERPYSSYWFILEWYRLRLEHPELATSILLSKGMHPVPLPNIQKLLELFRQSVQNGYVFGLDNPWS